MRQRAIQAPVAGHALDAIHGTDHVDGEAGPALETPHVSGPDRRAIARADPEPPGTLVETRAPPEQPGLAAIDLAVPFEARAPHRPLDVRAGPNRAVEHHGPVPFEHQPLPPNEIDGARM